MNLTKNTLFFCLTLTVLLAGCASTGGAKSKWLGSSESELLAALGKPDNTAVQADGRKMLTWNFYDTPGQVVPCSQSYTIDPNGIVADFVTSNCAPKAIMPPMPRSRRGF